MQDNYINSNKIKENKYKILRMSLILGSDENREETLTNFEESAREIDAMNDETYLREIDGKFYDTLKLEEEEKKLAVLVDYIGGRVDQRISLLSDFANITGYDLTNLPPIKYYDKLDDYKERLKYIREYLSNTEQINVLDNAIAESEQKLNEAYVNKATSEECNERNEEIIFSKFTNLIKNLAPFKDVTIENVDSKINNVISVVEESKKSLDIFAKSYSTLKGSGISYDEEIEYKSYVDNAEDIYYENKEQEYLLRIYKLLFNTVNEYAKIIEKREIINQILYERMELRKELEITSSDLLSPLYELLERQYKEIEQQKNNIDNIEYLTKTIEQAKEDRAVLDEANQKVEILALLREFCIIDTYADIDSPVISESTEPTVDEILENNLFDNNTYEDNTINEDVSSTEEKAEELVIPEDLFIPSIGEETTLKEEQPKENQVVAVENTTNIDIELVQAKASKVMKRVGEMLGIKTKDSTIVSVTNEEPVIQPQVEETAVQQETEEIPAFDFKEETNTTEEPVIQNNPLPLENPLFNNNIGDSNETPADPEDDNSFWFPSDMPDALNDLPDLEVSNNNFFGNGEMPDLNFPDLKLDFGNNDTEEK